MSSGPVRVHDLGSGAGVGRGVGMKDGSLNSDTPISICIGRSRCLTVGRWREGLGGRKVPGSIGSWGGGSIVVLACLFAVVTMLWLIRSRG